MFNDNLLPPFWARFTQKFASDMFIIRASDTHFLFFNILSIMGSSGGDKRTPLLQLTQQNQPIEPVEVETSFYQVFVGFPNHWKFLSHIVGIPYGIAILARSNNRTLGVQKFTCIFIIYKCIGTGTPYMSIFWKRVSIKLVMSSKFWLFMIIL